MIRGILHGKLWVSGGCISPDDESDVSTSLGSVMFNLTDAEGDSMDYTVETSPDVGSSSGSSVGIGEYSCPLFDLSYSTTYRWFVNVTDGNSWSNITFSFTTEEGPLMPTDYDTHYYRRVNLSNKGENYVTLINVTKLVGDDLSAHIPEVSCNGHCQDDFGDIRFVAVDNITNCSFWMEKKVDGDYAWFWVKNVNNDSYVYMRYNNTENSVTSSNGTATFLLFDDFDGDLSLWTSEGSDSWSVSDGNLEIEPSNDNNYLFSVDNVSDYGVAVETKVRSTSAGDGMAHPGFVWHASSGNNDHVYLRPHEYGNNGQNDIQPAYYDGSLHLHDGLEYDCISFNNWSRFSLRLNK